MDDASYKADIARDLTLMILQQAFEAKEVKIDPKIQGLKGLAEDTAEVYKMMFKTVSECLEEDLLVEVIEVEEPSDEMCDNGHGDEEQFQEEKGFGDDPEKEDE